jgi:hypothetical protein
MKTLALFSALLFAGFNFNRQHTPLQHGSVYGIKPDTTGMIKASQVEAFMDKKTRISITLKATVLKVTRQKGGWFTIDAGNGKIIAAHFKVYNVTLPLDLAGRTIIADGIAQKQFIADDMQHLAGDTVHGKKQHSVKTNAKQKVTFEVKGLMVE